MRDTCARRLPEGALARGGVRCDVELVTTRCATPASSTPVSRRTGTLTVSFRGTIFLVDDDEALRRATTRLLGACGFTVRAYGSAEEFLASYDPEAPGCLLVDVWMPGQSGLELQRTLQEQRDTRPVVVMTGHADGPMRAQALRRGAIAFLEKPVREEELVAALDRALLHGAPPRTLSASDG
jgi:FixJ family two-component response regulator